MANQDDDGRSGSELHQSQSGGDSGEFGGNRNQVRQSGQQGGGPGSADMTNAGGSGGTGGYGSSQDVVNHQDQQPNDGAQSGLAGGDRRQGGGSGGGQSRGERYDEAQGGGRGADDVSPSADELEFADDQRDHQERGQADAEFNAEEG
jgi:hypothetical protein